MSVKAAALFALTLCGMPLHGFGALLHGQTQAADPNLLRVQVLSGKTGRPVANTHILLWRSVQLDTLDGARNNPGANTDGEGYVSIPATDSTTFYIHVELHRPCSKDVPAFSLMDMRARGVVSQNTCSSRIKLYPQVGTLIFFVRDETFFEKLLH